MNYEEILQTVRGFCAREKLLDGKKHLALAVSGGADSMALLCLIRPLAEEKGIALTVCHVNHGLRGGDGGPGTKPSSGRSAPGWACRCGCSMPLSWKPRRKAPGGGGLGAPPAVCLL